MVSILPIISQQQRALRRHSQIGGTENDTFFRHRRMRIGKEKEEKKNLEFLYFQSKVVKREREEYSTSQLQRTKAYKSLCIKCLMSPAAGSPTSGHQWWAYRQNSTGRRIGYQAKFQCPFRLLLHSSPTTAAHVFLVTTNHSDSQQMLFQ